MAEKRDYHEYVGKTFGLCKVVATAREGNKPRFIVNCLQCGEQRTISRDNLNLIIKGKISGKCSKCSGKEQAEKTLKPYKEKIMEKENNVKSEPVSIDTESIDVQGNANDYLYAMAAYVINTNRDVIEGSVDRILKDGTLKAELIKKANNYIAQQMFIGAPVTNFDKWIENVTCTPQYMEQFFIGGTKIVEKKVEVPVEKIVEKTVEVLPKGALLVPDDVRPLVRDYIGKIAETERVIVSQIIKDYKSIDFKLKDLKTADKSILDVIDMLLKEHEELSTIKQGAKELKKMSPADSNIIIAKNSLKAFLSYPSNAGRILAKKEIARFCKSTSDIDKVIEQGKQEGWLIQVSSDLVHGIGSGDSDEFKMISPSNE